MFTGETVIVYGRQFGIADFEAVVLENPKDGFVMISDKNGNYYKVDINAVKPIIKADKNEWVLKNYEGEYVEEINRRVIVWTTDLAKARKYTKESFAKTSLKNYNGPTIHLKPIKLKVYMRETV
jgi:hypothetical protein